MTSTSALVAMIAIAIWCGAAAVAMIIVEIKVLPEQERAANLAVAAAAFTWPLLLGRWLVRTRAQRGGCDAHHP
jgi:hypothetical protein